MGSEHEGLGFRGSVEAFLRNRPHPTSRLSLGLQGYTSYGFGGGPAATICGTICFVVMLSIFRSSSRSCRALSSAPSTKTAVIKFMRAIDTMAPSGRK